MPRKRAGAGYIIGSSDSTSADFGSFTMTSQGGKDAFAAKLDSDGNILWTRDWGGTGRDNSVGLTVDDSGGVFVTGEFEATVDFDPGPAVSELTSAGGQDGYLLRLNSAGDLVSAISIGGPATDTLRRVAIDVDYGDINVDLRKSVQEANHLIEQRPTGIHNVQPQLWVLH